MSARRRALAALTDITDRGAYANLRLKQDGANATQAENEWVSAAVYTTLDHLYYIDYVIAAFAKGKLQPAIRGILRLGVCQALFMQVPLHAACSESAKLTKEIGKGALSGYVNGVMRSICRAAEADALPPLPQEERERLSIAYSYPLFLVDEYLERYGADLTQTMLRYKSHGMTLRTQPPYTDAAFADWLRENGHAYRQGEIVPEAFCLSGGLPLEREPLFVEGCITAQSESAMLVCRALGVRENMRVLDACSAPGGKTAYLSALMHGSGRIEAWELHPHRAALTQRTLARLHVQNADVCVRDARVYDAAFAQSMDAVLVDAPCSGFGVTNKPDVRYAHEAADVQALAQIQREILEACCGYVKPGGVLLYATCTISHAENQAQIQGFLQRHPAFRPGSLAFCLPESMHASVQDGMLQLFPHIHHTDGFFLAKMERTL